MEYYEEAFPQDAQFYHNVTVIDVAIARDIWNADFDTVWYLERLTALRPMIFSFHQEERDIIDQVDVDISLNDEDNNNDWILDYYENCIVKIDPDGTITWYEDEF